MNQSEQIEAFKNWEDVCSVHIHYQVLSMMSTYQAPGGALQR